MPRILLFLILALQGIPVQQGATVTGILRDSRGTPVGGVRVAAVARGDVIENAAGESMAGITETDTQGRFTLENIPPGRYFIAAGRLDLQTYYPGTQVLADATVLTISPGSTIANINYVLNDSSFGRADSGYGAASASPTATIPVTVRVENGGKLPVTANGMEISLALSSSSGQFIFPIEATAVSVPGPLSADFSVKVDGLPLPYKVKSITYGGKNITNGTFPLTPANFSTSSTLKTMIILNGTIGLYVATPVSSSTAAVPPSALSIALDYASPQKAAGVRVSGTIASIDKPMVYISGVPGVVFADRTFEFQDVPPGRHLIAGMHRFTPQAALVVVGNRDVEGIGLKRTLAQPDISVPQAIPPAGPYSPGTVISLPRIVGTAVDEKTGKAIVDGMVTVENEDYRRMYSLDSNGRFESYSLFPGSYDVTLSVIGHVVSAMKVMIDDKDVQIKLAVSPDD